MIAKIKEMFLLDGKSKEEISEELGISMSIVEKTLKKFNSPKRSKGEDSMLSVLKEIYPSHKIKEQEYFGGQYFDFYLPGLRLAFEYDGIQHSEENAHFHGKGYSGKFNFEKQVFDDRKKETYARQSHIYVIRIPHTEKLNVNNIRRIIDENYHAILDNLAAYNADLRSDV